jgi:hypothetical protein
MDRSIIGTAIALGCLLGCDSQTQSPPQSPVARAQPATVYAAADGSFAWHVQNNRFWSGSPSELSGAPLSEAPASVIYSRTSGGTCVNLDGIMILGAPDTAAKGVRFQCGATRFQVVDCSPLEECYDTWIEAIWRTGVAPNYQEIPVNYFYNRCRGIQSITFSLERPLKVGLGATLELRQGIGLLAQPKLLDCKSDPRSRLYEQ